MSVAPVPACPRGAVTRRNILRGAGLAGAAALLAACSGRATGGTGSGEGGRSTDTDAASSTTPTWPDRSDTDKTVNWSNWPEYLDTADDDAGDHPTLTQFREQTGITVNYVEDVNDNDEYFAKLQPLLVAGKVLPVDMFVVSDWMFTRLARLGYLQELDHANIPNLANALPGFQKATVDPGRKRSVTWQSGFTGIAYNAAVTGRPIETVDQLLTDPALRGKVTLLTEMVDTVGLVLLDMGYNSEDFTDEQFAAAMTKLQSAVDSGQVRQFTGNDYLQGLVSGDVAACMAWTGDVVQLQQDNPDLQYLLPEPGFMLWSDNLVIPNGAQHKRNAEAVINFYYQPEIAAQVADWVNYISPVAGTKEVLEKQDPEVAANPLIFPDSAVLNRGSGFMVLDEQQDQRYSKQFSAVRGA